MAEKTLTRDLHTFEKLDDLDHKIAKERERGSFPSAAVDKKPRDGDGDDDMRSADIAAVEQAAWPIMRMLEETTINRVIGDYQKDVRLVKEDTKLSDALRYPAHSSQRAASFASLYSSSSSSFLLRPFCTTCAPLVPNSRIGRASTQGRRPFTSYPPHHQHR